MEAEVKTGEELMVAMEEVDPNLELLIQAVREMDGPPNPHPSKGWDEPKWKVFNAAVRFVRSGHGTPATERRAARVAESARRASEAMK